MVQEGQGQGQGQPLVLAQGQVRVLRREQVQASVQPLVQGQEEVGEQQPQASQQREQGQPGRQQSHWLHLQPRTRGNRPAWKKGEEEGRTL